MIFKKMANQIQSGMKRAVLLLDLIKSENFKFIAFASPGHFYSPIPDAKSINENANRIFNSSVKELAGIDLNTDVQNQLAIEFNKYQKEMPFPDIKTVSFRYYFDNAFYSYGDGVILYSFMRHFCPKRIVEVGSGFSSALMLDVDELFFDQKIHFTFIEPYPDRLFSLLSKNDRETRKIEARDVQSINVGVFRQLVDGDILFIDSSHVAKTNSDVLYILFEVLPLLNIGVIVHFHDVCWPFEYPEKWLKQGRAWNEAYFLRAFLMNNKCYEILYFNSYMEIHNSEIMGELLPKVLKSPTSAVTPSNTSLWIRKIK